MSAADGIREHCRLEHILKLDSWPVLYVCGVHHVEPFRALLEANNISIHVLLTNWAPNCTVQRTAGSRCSPSGAERERYAKTKDQNTKPGSVGSRFREKLVAWIFLCGGYFVGLFFSVVNSVGVFGGR